MFKAWLFPQSFVGSKKYNNFTDLSNICSCILHLKYNWIRVWRYFLPLELSNYVITLHLIIIYGTNAMNLYQSQKNVFLFHLKCGRSKLNKSQIFRSNALQWLNCILPPGFDLGQSLLACIRCNQEKHSILMQFAHFQNQRCSLKTGCNKKIYSNLHHFVECMIIPIT